MNVVCIGTLDKFSRFYIDIKRHLYTKADSKINLKIFSIHLSGFLYTFLHLEYSNWISVKSWYSAKHKKRFYSEIINNQKKYKGVDFNECIKFHKKLNENILIEDLQLQALAYIDIFDKIFRKEKPDFLITIGDSRLSIEVAVALAKLNNIKFYFIEQGPFNTTFFDSVGVNANLSIRGESINDINAKENPEVNIDLMPNTSKYKRLLIYRGLDIFLMKILESTKLYPPDLKFTDLNSFRVKRSPLIVNSIKNDNNIIILLVLQVPLDVNMINHSPHFKSHIDIIDSVYSNLPTNTNLIVREHPLYINKYKKEVYSYILKHDIVIDNSTPLTSAIKMSSIVVVNNSTVGIESIFSYKTTVVLGDAFYDNDKICLKLKTKNELKALLEKAIIHKPDIEQIDNYKRLLFNTVLLDGGISDKNLVASKTIANRLLNAE